MINIIRYSVIFLFLQLYTLSLFAQNILEGKVLDANNQPIANVSVKVRNLSLETTANQDGTFRLFVPKGETLQFKKKGWQTKSIKIKNHDRLTVILKAKKNAADVNVRVDGKVVDYASREPLIGANVFIKYTNSGTATDKDGTFLMTVPKGSTLIISYGQQEEFIIQQSGYQEFAIGKLDNSIPPIGEQIHIHQTDFNTGNIHHPIELIQGRVAGLQITQGGGNNPFGKKDIRMRGLATFNGRGYYQETELTNDEPLFVLNGMPILDASFIDPLMITSFKIIKDGTTAKYGIRGANGVIEINTKRLDANAQNYRKLTYQSYLGIDKPNQTMKFMDAAQYRSFGGGNDLGESTNWFEAVSRTALSQVHQLNLSSGQQNTQLDLGVNYREAQGILQNQGFDRLQLNAQLQQKAFADKLTINAQILASSQSDNYSEPLAFRYAQTINPTAPVFDENNEEYGGYSQQLIFNNYNPVAIIGQNENTGKKNILLTQLNIAYDIHPDLSVKGSYHQINQQHHQQHYSSKYSLFGNGQWRNGYAEKQKINNQNQQTSFELNYRPQIIGIQSKINLGHEFQLFNQTQFNVAGGDFLTDAFASNNLSAAGDFANGKGILTTLKTRHQLSAFYGNIDLNWQNRLILNAGWRIEGSSRLGENNKWGRFPYVALGINTSQIIGGFFNKNEINFTASYGVSGNLPFANYLSLDRLRQTEVSFQNGLFQPGYGLLNNGNPNLEWEKNAIWNIGANAAFQLFSKPLKMNIAIYGSRATDIITSVPRVIAQDGLGNKFSTNIYENSGALKSQGFEGTLSYPIMDTKRFDWATQLVFATNKTTLVKYYPDDAHIEPGLIRVQSSPSIGGCCKIPTSSNEANTTIGDIYVLEYLRLDQDGQFVFSDINRDGFVDNEDLQKAGNGLPNFTLGWNNNLTLGNFDIQLFFQGAFGHQNFNITRKLAENPTQISAYNLLATTADDPARRITDFPQENSLYVENASYLRLKNLSIGYTFYPTTQKVFSQLRLYFTGQDLLTFTGYKGWDPSVRLDSFGDVFGAGYDYRTTYLPTKSFVFGVQVGL